MTVKELKPCPFCGGKAKVYRNREYNAYRACCSACFIETVPYPIKQDAINVWNNRPHKNSLEEE